MIDLLLYSERLNPAGQFSLSKSKSDHFLTQKVVPCWTYLNENVKNGPLSDSESGPFLTFPFRNKGDLRNNFGNIFLFRFCSEIGPILFRPFQVLFLKWRCFTSGPC